MTSQEYQKALKRTYSYLKKAAIVIRQSERRSLEIVDFSLGRLEEIGLQLFTYINDERYCAKELVLFPYQICPEHRHPRQGKEPGKKETFRCRLGQVYLYVPGPKTENPQAVVPEDKKKTFTVWREIILTPGDQYTIQPDTRHWFQGGPEGAVVSEFSSHSHDESDIFTDEEVERVMDPVLLSKIVEKRKEE